MKYIKTLFLSFAMLSVLASAASAQETEAAISSGLTGITLPADAQRVLPNYVPAEITQGLDKIVAAGDGKIRRGDTEVLIWSGTNYKKANAAAIIKHLTDKLKIVGWQYAAESGDNGLTVFSVFKNGASRRAVLGFYDVTDEALIFAWSEVLQNGGVAENSQIGNDSTVQNSTKQNAGKAGGIVGTWTNGNVSMLSEKNLSNGAISSRGGSTFKYVFKADGSFEFIGLINSTMYGCTTSLFNDKRGRYEISGTNITFIPSKNFWRNMYSCSPSSNKERDYVLERETYSFRTKTDEYGAILICLTNTKGESCYRKED